MKHCPHFRVTLPKVNEANAGIMSDGFEMNKCHPRGVSLGMLHYVVAMHMEVTVEGAFGFSITQYVL